MFFYEEPFAGAFGRKGRTRGKKGRTRGREFWEGFSKVYFCQTLEGDGDRLGESAVLQAYR